VEGADQVNEDLNRELTSEASTEPGFELARYDSSFHLPGGDRHQLKDAAVAVRQEYRDGSG